MLSIFLCCNRTGLDDASFHQFKVLDIFGSFGIIKQNPTIFELNHTKKISVRYQQMQNLKALLGKQESTQ